MQVALPLLAAKDPELQSVIALEPVEHECPAVHSVHSVSLVRSIADENVPAVHGSAAEAPSGQYEPAMHCSQPVWPALPCCVPAAHGSHDGCPSEAVKLPGVHGVGSTAPVEHDEPVGQLVHSSLSPRSVALE